MVREKLVEAVQATMEEMFFLEVDEPRFHWARVTVEKPFAGGVTLALPQRLMEDVARGLMPEETVFGDQLLQDTLAELVNTVAGKLVGSVVSGEVTFRLSVPRTGVGWPRASMEPVSIHPFQIDRKCFIVLLEGATLGSLTETGT